VTRVIGALIYLSACLVAVVFVSAPLAIVTAGAGLAGGAGAAFVAVVLVLVDNTGAGVLTPSGVRDGLPGRVGYRFVRRDRAWPQYFSSQIARDARGIVRLAGTWGHQMWGGPVNWLTERNWTGLWAPLTLPPLFAALTAASAGLAVAVGATLVLIVLVAAVAWTAGLPVVYLLRAGDVAWRRIWRSRASCTNCFATADVPAYRCTGRHSAAERAAGDDLHRDMRPGRLGVLWRRCSCRALLPTTVLRAAHSSRLQACCPSCAEPLFEKAGVVRDVRAPVFGAASAGKTQFIMSALVGLRHAGRRAGVQVTLPDRRGQLAYEVYADLMRRNAPAPKTDTTAPVAVTVRIEQGLNTTLLHLFDAAGETLVDPEQNAGLAYLDTAEALTFVLDPFSIRRIREEHGTASADVFTDANAALHDPEDSYNVTAQRLQEYGVPTGRRRLAFVVTKADLLTRLPIDLPAQDSESVRAWLAGLALDNLILSARRDFREVRFFLVSGRDKGPDGPVSVLRWLLLKGWGNIG
jgi:hypothetical protein